MTSRPPGPLRPLLLLLLFALHGLAREVDRAVGLLLHSTLDLPDFVPLALSLVDPGAAALAAGSWTAVGLLAWLALAALLRRAPEADASWATALASAADAFTPLLLRPALTLVTLAALAWDPAYPYGFTLPVALTQDWGFAQDAAAAAAIVAGLWPVVARAVAPAPRALARVDWRPRASEVLLLAFLTFGLLTPEGARWFEAHPGNEPKYLRMALALGHGLTLDVDTVSAPMEQLAVEPLGHGLARAARRAFEESAGLTRALLRGDVSLSPESNTARGVAHLTVRASDGGAYHVLAPGPALLLAPALRIDRALNRARGTPGRVGLTLLLWNLLAAGVVAATFELARVVARSAGLAALVATAVGLTPPLLFYSFQFYPEVPAALIVAWSARRLTFGRPLDLRACALLGLLIAVLPWLHQKYLPLGLALLAWATLRAVDSLVAARDLVALLVPPALAGWAFAVYNFALTGSPRPDALFRALGREGVGFEHLGQGALGLLLDARYGLLPYVPWLLVALAGLLWPAGRALRAAAPAAVVYFLTVAAAENWTGSISNLGRFLLPLVPLAAACAAPALRAASRPCARLLLFTLAAWSAALARLLWIDPAAANDSGVLLASGALADGNVYLPTLLLRRWSDAAPALPAQLAAWALLAWLAARTLRPVPVAPGREVSAGRGLALLVALLLVLGWGLERWPGRRGQARFPGAVSVAPDVTVFVLDGGRVEGPEIVTEGGPLRLLVRLEGRPVDLSLRLDGRDGKRLDAPLADALRLRGRRGLEQTLAFVSVPVAAPHRFEPHIVASSSP